MSDLKGRAKEAAGDLTDDKDLKREGQIEQAADIDQGRRRQGQGRPRGRQIALLAATERSSTRAPLA